MSVTPVKNSSLSKKDQVAGMFNNIARRYDFLNHLLSLGVDHYWRWRTISIMKKENPKLILDVATGTGALALSAVKLNPDKIFGVDISEDMLAIGRAKIKAKKLTEKIELFEGDSENLIFSNDKFDAVMVAFGVRNFENLLKGLQEFHRVLKPGKMAFVLEFSHPENKIIKSVYRFYSSRILPVLGKKISKNETAYQYLHDSVEAFPSGDDFLNILKQAGFRETKSTSLTFGVVTVYTGRK
ncbi:MAG: bifunctional demethylmenaquinone methyltransferase/2-methoxy-6-polyprenyl-1,4-benzoquinol methylase UbiE [Bacteroidetes bacterium]|nr:bifunctional demethylmenaquinone methyltransferase/2-methoxy-6-polyprenyl-1,4-benzoquinol methylase UbiE [Bacteroidota bacterium]